jgi:hypothetical protein
MRLQNHSKGHENDQDHAFNFQELLMQLAEEEKSIAKINAIKEDKNLEML